MLTCDELQVVEDALCEVLRRAVVRPQCCGHVCTVVGLVGLVVHGVAKADHTMTEEQKPLINEIAPPPDSQTVTHT